MNIKLNLGCHNSIRSGYVNIDKDIYPGVDMVSDVFNLDYPDGVASEIYASNILEHAPHTQSLLILKRWYKILAPGGILKLSVPDFDIVDMVYKECGLIDWAINFLYGDQVYEGAYHYCIFTEDRLTKLLKDTGFRDISRVEQLPGNLPGECSNNALLNCGKLTGKLVSLNMVAIKG